MRERAFVCAVAVIVSLWLCQPEARAQEPAAPQRNLVANGDFSAVSAGKPANWESAGDSAFVTQSLRVGRDAGQSCAVLACTRLERQTPSAHAMLAQVGQVKLVKGRMYEFSCRVRSEGLAGRTVSVAITDTKAWTNCGLDSQIPVSGTWKDCRHIFRATRDVGPSSRLQIWFAETGTLYVADVRLVEHRQEDVDFTHAVPAGSGNNLLPNGSFEVGAGGWSSLGAGAGWGNLHRLHGSIEESGGQQGRSFLRIPIGEQNMPVLYFDYYEPVVRRELRPLAASVGWIKLEKGTFPARIPGRSSGCSRASDNARTTRSDTSS